MKKLIAMLLALAMVLSLAACGAKEEVAAPAAPAETQAAAPAAPAAPENDKLVVGFAQIGQESGWRDAETNDIQWYAARNTDTIELHFADAQQKQENQIKAIRNFIEMGVDVIAFPPVVETGWEAVLTECKEAGIPVILVDRGIDANADPELYTTMIASDHVWAGEQAAIVMNELLGGEGKVVELEGTVGASAAVQRKQGFDEYIAANCPGIEIIASQTGDFTRAMGKEVMESFLKTYDDFNVVYCHNDNEAYGAMDAMDAAGITYGVDGDVIIISFDATHDGLQYTLDGKIHCNVECNPIQALYVSDIIQMMEAGEEFPTYTLVKDEAFVAPGIESAYAITMTQEILDGRAY